MGDTLGLSSASTASTATASLTMSLRYDYDNDSALLCLLFLSYSAPWAVPSQCCAGKVPETLHSLKMRQAR